MVQVPVVRQATQSLRMLGGWARFSSICVALSLATLSFLGISSTDLGPSRLYAQEDGANDQTPGKAIYPVWRLLTRDQKMQFVAGYVQGWKDASKVTDIAIGFVRENPTEAVSGLERLKSLYDLSDVSPSLITTRLDTFFAKTENQSASLSYAISAAKAVSH
jgi:hypothetical protein